MSEIEQQLAEALSQIAQDVEQGLGGLSKRLDALEQQRSSAPSVGPRPASAQLWQQWRRSELQSHASFAGKQHEALAAALWPHCATCTHSRPLIAQGTLTAVCAWLMRELEAPPTRCSISDDPEPAPQRKTYVSWMAHTVTENTPAKRYHAGEAMASWDEQQDAK